ncbi:hypothetical protein PY650_12985 [Rhizobium calliandrae]|uniref:Uncharacterized protein n=1 Tax=Rhizobium calliandrae TaxID=1312182 RepID=A0ABT7KD59_9HYPH|nr:hypothetical protein [Rhizobium calliandrae]MDL2406560.1 hypothetical protein [Rhizobium calliandrae]
MTKVVVIGIEGEEGLWVVDLGARSVAPLHPPKAGTLKAVADLRAGGAFITKGVNLAVTVKAADSAFSGHLDG